MGLSAVLDGRNCTYNVKDLILMLGNIVYENKISEDILLGDGKSGDREI